MHRMHRYSGLDGGVCLFYARYGGFGKVAAG